MNHFECAESNFPKESDVIKDHSYQPDNCSAFHSSDSSSINIYKEKSFDIIEALNCATDTPNSSEVNLPTSENIVDVTSDLRSNISDHSQASLVSSVVNTSRIANRMVSGEADYTIENSADTEIQVFEIPGCKKIVNSPTCFKEIRTLDANGQTSGIEQTNQKARERKFGLEIVKLIIGDIVSNFWSSKDLRKEPEVTDLNLEGKNGASPMTPLVVSSKTISNVINLDDDDDEEITVIEANEKSIPRQSGAIQILPMVDGSWDDEDDPPIKKPIEMTLNDSESDSGNPDLIKIRDQSRDKIRIKHKKRKLESDKASDSLPKKIRSKENITITRKRKNIENEIEARPRKSSRTSSNNSTFSPEACSSKAIKSNDDGSNHSNRSNGLKDCSEAPNESSLNSTLGEGWNTDNWSDVSLTDEIVLHDSDEDSIVLDDSDNDNDSSSKEMIAISVCPTSKRCSSCSQYMDNIKSLLPKSKDLKYHSENEIILDPRVSVQDLDDDEEQQFNLYDFSLFDAEAHLVPLDSDLIEKGKVVRFNGLVQGVFSSSANDESSDGLRVSDCGPVTGWWITGLTTGEKASIGISTDQAYYYLREPSEQYSSLMQVLNEKVMILKEVYEVLESVRQSGDIRTFSYEDLLERLLLDKPELDSTHLIMDHGAFVVQQILSFEEADEFCDNETGILSAPLIQTLCSYTGFNPKTSKQKQSRPTRILRQRDPSYVEPNLAPKVPMSKATTTPLVRHFFEHLFKDQLANADDNFDRFNPDSSCGICTSCLRQDCGACLPCKSRSEFGGKNKSNIKQVCYKKQCEKLNIIHLDDDDDDDDDDTDDEESFSMTQINQSRKRNQFDKPEIQWIGEPYASMSVERETFYHSVLIDKIEIQVGDFVLVRPDDPFTPGFVCQVLYLYEKAKTNQLAHVSHFCRATYTVLGATGDPREVFATKDCETIQLEDVEKKIRVKYWKGASKWSHVGGTPDSLVTPAINDDDHDYWYKQQYDPETARFEDFEDILRNHDRVDKESPKKCKICEHFILASTKDVPVEVDDGRFSLNGETYEVGDAVYLNPGTFPMKNNIKKGFRIKKERKIDANQFPEHYRKRLQNGKEKLKGNYSKICDPFQVGIIQKIKKSNSGIRLNLRKLYRPENTLMSLVEVWKSDWNQLFWTQEFADKVDAASVRGKCVVLPLNQLPIPEPTVWCQRGNHRFYFEKEYDVDLKEFRDLPEEALDYRPPDDLVKSSRHPSVSATLKTLDVFAGCGGLSNGLENSGVAQVKWGIEFNSEAAKAFGLNHPGAKVINMDCNEVLKIAMADNKDEMMRMGIPQKGDVDLICGGPPCQGFSTMNTFTEREYSQFRNSCIASYLSFCDFYRPKFVILENVRNFFRYKKSVMIKLCLSALVRMGYQVTFGVLESGNFRIPQTRLRAFIIAAAPGQQLPQMPDPQNVFQKTPLRVLIDGKAFEPNVRWTNSAPFRNVITRDAISDLPAIESGESRNVMTYDRNPESHFQKLVRSGDGKLLEKTYDHICRKVPPITQMRMSLIPKRPGSDWRDLPNIECTLSDGTKIKKLKYRYGKQAICRCMSKKGAKCDPMDRQHNTIIPWAMVHTGNRNNQWVGCYGRVSYDSYFSTTITHPHPERKQGRVVHPSQDRVVSVRECARSQGFHDSFKFSGTMADKYRQIGNAVPPPVGRAIGLELRKAIVADQQKETKH